MPAIAFETVTKRYRSGALALQNVSWSVAEGSRACLLGPNGAGKSTSIRILEGALSPSSGRVTLLDRIVGTEEYIAARRQTGIVPQGPGMYVDLSTREYLQLSARLYRRREFSDVVEAFGLGDQLDKRMNQLSGGFQRRAVLASAFVGDPKVLLLDEPTVGLDPLAARQVHDFLRTMMPGRTVLLCTHNLAEAEVLCDQVIILRNGKVLLDAPLSDMRAHTGLRLRISARQGPEALTVALRKHDLKSLTADDGAVIVSINDAQVDGPPILRELLQEGLDVYECTVLRPSLEEMFIDLVRQPMEPSA